MTASSPATKRATHWCSTPRVGWRARGSPASRRGSSAKPHSPTEAARYRCSSFSPNAISTRATRRRPWPRPAASPRTGSAPSPPRSPKLPLAKRSRSPRSGPTGPGEPIRRCAGGRSRSMRCAASRRIPTASTPAARFICCRSCSVRSMCPGAGATNRPIQSRRRPARSRPGNPARSRRGHRLPGRRSAIR